MDIASILSRIPDSKRFLTVDEMDASALALAKEFPDAAEVFEAGRSQEGHPLYCLKIGNGSRNALIMGCPHPNEPIGAMMLEAFTRILCEDDALRAELDYTWYILKTVDPDGVRHNEGWFNGPYTLYNYARDFYRPASPQQVEWTFPLDYETLHFHTPLPETAAIMRIIEERKPSFLFSLHNSAFGGAYWYVSRPIQSLVDELPSAAARQDVPLALGEPEMPCCKEYGKAVYEFPGMPMMYDFYRQMLGGQDPAQMLTGGSSSVDFANSDGRECFGLVCEMPYFRHPDAMDLSETDIKRKDAIEVFCQTVEAVLPDILRLIDELCPHLDKGNCYRLALEERRGLLPKQLQTQRAFAQSPECERNCTRAQRFDNVIALPFYFVALTAGMIASAARQRTASAEGDERALLERIEREADAITRADCERIEGAVSYDVIPIRRLVSVQMESCLLAVKALSENRA